MYCIMYMTSFLINHTHLFHIHYITAQFMNYVLERSIYFSFYLIIYYLPHLSVILF